MRHSYLLAAGLLAAGMLGAGVTAAPGLAQTGGSTAGSPGTDSTGTGTGAATGTGVGNAGRPGVGTTGTDTGAGAGVGTGAGAGTGAGGGMLGGGNTSTHNPALADNGDVRASKVIGSSVYNDKNEKLGTVDDILVGKDQKAAQVVLSVGGVLGVGAKLVTVPYEKVKFPDNVDNNNSRVMLPGMTADALNGMPDFHYAAR